MKPLSTSPYHPAATKSHTQRGWLQRIAKFFHFARSTPEQPVKAGAYQRPSPGAKKPFNGKRQQRLTPQATTSTAALHPEQNSGVTELYTRVKPKEERELPQTQHQEPVQVQVQEQSAEITRPRPAPRQCNQHKLVKTPDDNASPGPNPESQADQVKTSDDNATLQQEQQPDPVNSALAKIRIGTGTTSTTIDNLERLVDEFTAHSINQLKSMKAPEQKRYLTHTRLLLNALIPRLNGVLLLAPHPLDTYRSITNAKAAILRFIPRIDNDLEGLEKVLKKQKNVRK